MRRTQRGDPGNPLWQAGKSARFRLSGFRSILVPPKFKITLHMRLSQLLACLGLFALGIVGATAQPVAASKKLVMLIAENEYETATTLPAFAAAHLAREFSVVTAAGSTAAGATAFADVSAVASADVLLVSVSRRPLPPEQLAVIRRHVAAGKAVVGIRTASHAFSPVKNQPLLPGLDQWPEFDAEVLGGNYAGHHGKGPVLRVTASDPTRPLLRGVPATFDSSAWLYRNTPLRPGAEVLLTGAIPGQPAEPVAWTFRRADGGRTFSTSLGLPADFKNPAFTRLLANGVRWAAGLPVVPEPPLRTPPDLAVDLIAREPLIAQPVFLNFDERGRMWVVQYLQYPEPAGLKVMARDSIWRIRYDQKKPAPPYDTPEKSAFRGRDRITILEDEKGDGSFTKVSTFVDGLNLTTAVARDRAGVWVLSPPQLLWYPDANHDDVPDGPPTVALDGFGIEDSHSLANSLRWGRTAGSTARSAPPSPPNSSAPVSMPRPSPAWSGRGSGATIPHPAASRSSPRVAAIPSAVKSTPRAAFSPGTTAAIRAASTTRRVRISGRASRSTASSPIPTPSVSSLPWRTAKSSVTPTIS